MKKKYTCIFSTLLFFVTLSSEKSFAQTTVFSDDFSTNTNAAYTTSGAIGASSWNVLVQNADWGARRNTSPLQLELTNDASAAVNASGWALASTDMSVFSAPYNTTLNLNTGAVTWNFNIRQIRTDPAGMGSGSYGAAFILAGTSTTTRTAGTGYAITYGQSGATDPVRLIEYTAGLGTSSNIITSNTTGLTDFGAEYLSVRVIYTPSSNTWELLLRNDGAAAFADPAAGVLVSQGTAVNSTYTGTPLALMGAFWNGSTAGGQTAFFDNTSVIVGPAATPTVSVAPGVNATEGGASGTYTITFNPATAAAGTLDYAFTGAAGFSTDYNNVTLSAGTPSPLVTASGTINVPSGTSSIVVTLPATDDPTTNENIEDIILAISNPPAGYIIGTGSSTIYLLDNEATKLSSIQGSGTAAFAATFVSEAIVTGIYPTLSPAGFYIQEEDADVDADPLTSEGIFVVSAASVSVGDRVTVAGTVQENGASPSFNQAVFATAAVTVLSSGNPLPTATDITLPVTAITDYEKYEGMIVRFPGTLTVTDNSTLGNFGELKLSSGGLVFQASQVVDPNDNPPGGTNSTGASNVAAINAHIASNTLRTILLDDGRGGVMPSLPYVNVDNTVRVGSTIDNISGILGYAFSQYRIQPIASAVPSFTHAARPSVPGYGAGANLKVVSLNVLNYFNGNGAGGGFPTPRGAHSLAEFNRQRDKIINAISQMDADLVGLIELENQDLNDATPALSDLVNGLNALMGPGTYSFIDDDLDNNGSQDNNTDQIRCAIIYKPAVLTPVGNAMLGSDAVFDRPPLVQTFNLASVNKNFNFIVNHFKSKGGCPGAGVDADQLDGQSCWNNRRKLQANALLSFINTTVIPTSGTNRIISVGDYNAYFEEDPMDILRAAGNTVLGASSTYSYLFSGQLGALDHAVVSPSMAGLVTGFSKWNANSVEPEYLDYNDAINDGGGDAVNPWASTYTVSPWRSGDHDAVMIGFNLPVVLPASITSFSALKENNRSKIYWKTVQEINTREFIVERSINGGATWQVILTVPAAGNSNSTIDYVVFDANPAKGTNLYRLKSVDIDNKYEFSATRRVNFDNLYTFNIYPNPATDILRIAVDNASALKANIQVLNSQGQVMVRKQITEVNQPAQVIISSLSPGVYFIKIVTADGSLHMQKFTRQ